jgi:hypothetical protein
MTGEDFYVEEGSMMMLRRLYLFVVLLGLLLVLSACGTPPQPSTGESLWTEARFGAYIQQVGTQSRLGTLAGNGNSALASLAGIPASGPIGNLSALASPNTLRQSDVALALLQGLAIAGSPQLSDLAPANNSGAQPLPTGIWEYNKFKNVWTYLGASDNLVVKFYWGNIPYNGTHTYITLTVDWDALSSTTQASRGGVSYEVPTGLKIYVNKDGIDAGSISISIDWTKACDGRQLLDPSSIKIKGEFSHQGSDVAIDFEVNLYKELGSSHLATQNNTCTCTGTQDVTIKSDGYVRVAFDGSQLTVANNTGDKNDSVKVFWNNVFYAQETRDSNCDWLDLKIKSGEIDFGATFKLNGKEDTLQLRFTFSNIVKDQNGIISIDLDGKIKVNGQIVVLFEGTLDATGQHLKLTFADGSMTLAEFIQKYLGNVDVPIGFLLGINLGDLPSLPF